MPHRHTAHVHVNTHWAISVDQLRTSILYPLHRNTLTVEITQTTKKNTGSRICKLEVVWGLQKVPRQGLVLGLSFKSDPGVHPAGSGDDRGIYPKKIPDVFPDWPPADQWCHYESETVTGSQWWAIILHHLFHPAYSSFCQMYSEIYQLLTVTFDISNKLTLGVIFPLQLFVKCQLSLCVCECVWGSVSESDVGLMFAVSLHFEPNCCTVLSIHDDNMQLFLNIINI